MGRVFDRPIPPNVTNSNLTTTAQQSYAGAAYDGARMELYYSTITATLWALAADFLRSATIIAGDCTINGAGIAGRDDQYQRLSIV